MLSYRLTQPKISRPYEPHLVGFESHDQLSLEFLSLNPNNKIPVEAVDQVGNQDFLHVTRALAAFVARGLGIPRPILI